MMPIQKTQRTPEERSGGGLTRLPTESDDDQTAPENEEYNEDEDENDTDLAELQDLEKQTAHLSMTINDIAKETVVPQEGDDDEEKEEGNGTSESVVQDILRRHFDWDERRVELDNYLKRIKENGLNITKPLDESLVPRSANKDATEEEKVGSLPCLILGRGKTLNTNEKELEEKMRIKILRGLKKIHQLDLVLKEKTQLADSFSDVPEEGEEREDDGFGDGVGSEMSAQEFELRSVHSDEVFVTEPKFMRRNKRTRAPAPTAESHQKREHGSPEQDGPKLKGYKQGDFIQRNIVLGGNARYYHAMTEEEMARVDNILKFGGEKEDELAAPPTPMTQGSEIDFSVQSIPWLDPSSKDEVESLINIDRKLSAMGSGAGSIIAESRFSSIPTSAATTRLSKHTYQSGTVASTQHQQQHLTTPSHASVTALEIATRDESQQEWVAYTEATARLQAIDEELDKLKAIESDGASIPLASREDIQRLLESIMAEEGVAAAV